MDYDLHAKREDRGGRARRAPLTSALFVAAYALARLASWTSDHVPAPKPPHAGKDRPERDERPDGPAPAGGPEPRPDTTRQSVGVSRRKPRRLAGALVFATLFFAGAALSAIAGDTVGSLATSGQAPDAGCGEPGAATGEEDPEADPDAACETTTGESAETAPGSDAGQGEPVTTVPDDGATEPPAPQPPAADGEADAGAAPEAPAPPADANDPPPGGGGSGPPRAERDDPPVLDVTRVAAPRALDPEAEAGDGATVWLHRLLPDPTPPARRLAPAFARDLRAAARRNRLPWSFLLGVVRAHGKTGRVPVARNELAGIAARLAAERDVLGAYRPWLVALRYSGRTAFADRALALTRYNRATGLHALVTGLAAARTRLAARVLADGGIELYAGGRGDVAVGRTDVRVLVLLRYLRIAYGSVTVSSLTTGHRIYSRPGVVSAHTYGLAVDIAALGGTPIAGNQEPNGLTEQAVRDILLLPAEVAPQQVISLLGLGGPSFPLADHGDHIHVGY